MMYRPYWDWMPYRTVLAVRAARDARSVAPALRAAIRKADADVPIPRMRTMSEVLDEGVITRRFQMLLAVGFAISALAVASLGIYAVVSYSVSRRTGEIGIRAALGARAADIYLLVLRQGMAPVVAGLAAGVAGAAALERVVHGLLYQVSGHDPLTFFVAAAGLAAIALVACVIPAHRASRVNPLTALRYE